MASKWKHRMEYGAFVCLFQMTRLLPRRALLAVGRGLGVFVWRVVGFRRRVVLDNLTAAFGSEKDEAWIQRTAQDFYRNLGMTLVEFLASGHRSIEDLKANVTIEGREHLEAVVDRGRGGVIVSGHLGNFELMAARTAATGHKAHGVVKTQSNRLIDKFYNDIRTRQGMGIIRTGGSFSHILKALADGGVVGVLGDQDAGSKGQFVDFLGRPASVTRGPAALAVKAQCPILMVFVFRQPDHRHVMRFDPPIEIDPAWAEETAIRRLTEMHTARLEAAVREAPAMYYWVHRRWKTRPPQD